MSLFRFLIILAFGTALSWAAWALVLLTIDPFTGGVMAHGLFYGSFFLALVGTVTLVGFFGRYWLEKETVLFRQVGVALRQAVNLAAGATAALALQSARMLHLWTILLLILFMAVVEAFFLAGQSRRPRAPA